MQKQDYLNKFREDRLQWERLLMDVGETRMNTPGVSGVWTFKDVIAHLTGWRKRTVARIRAGCDGMPLGPMPWPAELDGDNEDHVEVINQFIYEANRDKPLQQVLDESRVVLDQLDDALLDLPQPAFDDPHCFTWLKGKPLGQLDLFEHLHEEHMPAIEAWLEKQRLYVHAVT